VERGRGHGLGPPVTADFLLASRGAAGFKCGAMTRARTVTAWVVFLATFLWLLAPEVRGSPAVLWPSVVAVGLAFVTRDIYLSLFLGAFTGAILLRSGNVFAAFLDLFARHLLPALKDPWNLGVLVFTLLMGGFVELLRRNGGMTALAGWFLGRAHSRRRAALGAYGLGWLLFIDGLANSMLVGKAMRPITDRAGLSRAKLAFIVDSTSSPIAGLALISTWVAYELSVIRQGFENVGDAGLLAAASPFQLLVLSLPYRFYNWYALLIVFLTIWLARDFGPMLTAERHAERPATTDAPPAAVNPVSPHRAWLALAPLAVLVFGVFAGLFIHGGGLHQPFTLAGLIDAFGKADAALVFVWITAFAVVVTLILSALFPSPDPAGGHLHAFFEGMKQMFLPALILVFAWTLNAVIKEMGTAPYLVALLHGRLPAAWLPAMVFALAALVSFSTGTSWGTMALVMPLVIPLAVTLTGAPAADVANPVLIATIGAVLAGAVFGDHCSPISDTTIVSAFASDCDAMEHVRTQLPYAVAAALLAVVLGYGPAGWGVPWYVLLALGAAACWALIRYLGQPGARGRPP
jgi:Na+/H+ antiporter NhaC